MQQSTSNLGTVGFSEHSPIRPRDFPYFKFTAEHAIVEGRMPVLLSNLLHLVSDSLFWIGTRRLGALESVVLSTCKKSDDNEILHISIKDPISVMDHIVHDDNIGAVMGNRESYKDYQDKFKEWLIKTGYYQAVPKTWKESFSFKKYTPSYRLVNYPPFSTD